MSGELRESTVVMTAETMAKALHRLAAEIIERNNDLAAVVLLGILTRGRPLADRLAQSIHQQTGQAVPVGSLATTLYRDDLRAGTRSAKFGGGETHFDFDVTDKTVILVDDVIAKGRTTRAALDEVMDYGRPARIQLACLIDRGHRELPIQPDYLGWSIATDPCDHVAVRLEEIDGENLVLLERARDGG